MTTFLKTTLVGGVLFLLPLAIVLMLLGYALKIASTVAEPISEQLELQHLGGLGAAGIVTVISAVVLVVVAFGAGLAARTYAGARMTRWFEGSTLGRLPHYQMVKSMAEGLTRLENENGIKPALVSIEGGWQMGYLLEPLENGWSTVFLPQAPTPMSGNIMYFHDDRVRPLGITMVDAMAIIKRMGVGSAGALRGADLKPPPGQ